MSLSGNRLRVILSILLLLIAFGAIALYLTLQGVREAPVALGNSQTGGDIVQGAPPREIAVTTDRDGSWDVVRLLPDGSVINTTDDGTDAVDVFASYDFASEVINFLSNRENPDAIGPSQVGAEGGEVEVLGILQAVVMMAREQRFDWDPAWSPDGEQLLWSSLRDLNLELYTTALDGGLSDISAATRRTRGASRDWFGSWSPDGSQLVYSSDAEGNENVYTLDLEADTPLLLTDNTADDIHAMFALDGSRIAFVSERDNLVASGTIDIFTMNLDGSDQRRLAEGEIFEGDPLWSPDGRYMLYTSNSTGSWQLFVLDSETDDVTQITDGEGNYLFPVWRP